jgi:hypothetical protein
MKKSLALSKSTAIPIDKESNSSHILNQHARLKI